jgi:hypothetical protein
MNRNLAIVLGGLCLACALAACGDNGDGKGAECEPCRSANPRCDSGLSCATFSGGGSTRELCAAPSTDRCTVQP